MAAAMSKLNASVRSGRLCRRYKIFFYFCFLILCIQLFLGFSFYTMNQRELTKIAEWRQEIDRKVVLFANATRRVQQQTTPPSLVLQWQKLMQQQQQFVPHVPKKPWLPKVSDKRIDRPADDVVEKVADDVSDCQVFYATEAVRAVKRAKTRACQDQLIRVACLNEKQSLYPATLPRLCAAKAEHEKGTYLGCYKDENKDRDLGNFHTEFRKDNTPQKCITYCETGGYLYAGVQYKTECWCGHTYGKHGKIAESQCRTACTGNASDTCGGFLASRVFSTGMAARKMYTGPLGDDLESVKPSVRIVFVLTVHGRAVRQVLRLVDRLYQSEHYFYIHVDSRSHYMYRELLKLESRFDNIRLARNRYATIWGGASLLQAHLSFMRALLAMTDWSWDYYINLSESDYPLKSVTALTRYLSKYKGKNFLKNNGREIPTFMRKQGLDQTFYECDQHLWRLGKREVPTGIRFDGGSDWITLHRDYCVYATSGRDPLVTGLKQLYNYTILAVESFFHTLLANSAFCDTLIDNNLHLTNWKRKLGCQCQHKDMVDWCGCSPNVFKEYDLDRFQKYEYKPTFFARKFEAIIDQTILNQIDSSLNIHDTDFPALSHYWQNMYHYVDPVDRHSDVTLTHSLSLMRRTIRSLSYDHPHCTLSRPTMLETHILNVGDNFNRYLIKYNVTVPSQRLPVTLESQYEMRRFYRVIDTPGPMGRLQSPEVGTDYDPKEQMFRNYIRVIGPYSEVALRSAWGRSPTGDHPISVAWIDPAGVVAAFKDVTITKDSLIDLHKPALKVPLRPGVWMVKILYKLKVSVEVKFIVLPLSIFNNTKVTKENVLKLNNGPDGTYMEGDYSSMAATLGIKKDIPAWSEASEANGQKTGEELDRWIDELTETVWSVQGTCSPHALGVNCPHMERCKDTSWSSLSPDPKSEIDPNV